jgi:hypothetical protein
VIAGVLDQERVLARQVVREVAFLRQQDFDDALARVSADGAGFAQRVIAVAEERLLEILRVLNEHVPGEVIAVSHEVLGHRSRIATCHAVATQPAFLQMRGGDLEVVANPFARRETHRRVLGELGRMRPAIHPECSLRAPGEVLQVDRHELLSLGVDLVPHANVREAIGVIRRMHATLIVG